jgi:hypothetical protein
MVTTSPTISDECAVEVAGIAYPAAPVANGAAYEIYSTVPADGFVPNPRDASGPSFRRFVHASEAELLAGDGPSAADSPMCVPLHASMSWAAAHRLSQSTGAAHTATLHAMRDSVAIRRGTRMLKILSSRQLAGFLRGWLPQGFCHREYDVAHLRTPADLAVLKTDGDNSTDADDVVFALRWRAVDASDYAVPYAADFGGLATMSPYARVGPPVLGTGFAPTNRHILPEFVTAELVDLPLPANAELIAFTDDGTEVLLYRYLAEQRAWGRLAGRQWRHLLAGVEGVAPDQEYFPVPPSPTQLVGLFKDQVYEAVADPRENEFLVLAKVRALRHSVTYPARCTPTVMWRETRCAVIRDNGEWLRVRLMRPDAAALERTAAGCVERGIYETWAPSAEVEPAADILVRYA